MPVFPVIVMRWGPRLAVESARHLRWRRSESGDPPVRLGSFPREGSCGSPYGVLPRHGRWDFGVEAPGRRRRWCGVALNDDDVGFLFGEVGSRAAMIRDVDWRGSDRAHNVESRCGSRRMRAEPVEHLAVLRGDADTDVEVIRADFMCRMTGQSLMARAVPKMKRTFIGMEDGFTSGTSSDGRAPTQSGALLRDN